MKKIFLFLSAALLILTGCQKEQERVYANTAAHDIAGTYTGTWTLTDASGNVTEGQGTVVFSEVENEPYVALMTFASETLGLSASTRANVSHRGDELVYFNNTATSLMPENASEDATVPAFQGKVLTDGSTSFSYTLKTGKGKKAKNITYAFSGAR